MNMNPQLKPFFILNPQVLINSQEIAAKFIGQLKKTYSGTVSRVHNLLLDRAAGASISNGIFDYDLFIKNVRNEAPAFMGDTVSKCLNAALDASSVFKFDEVSLKALMERGNVSLLLGVDSGMELSSYDRAGIKIPSSTTLIERRILRELRMKFGGELRETKQNDIFKVDEQKPLTTLQLENKKKSYGQLLHDYVDLVSDKKWKQSPKIIENDALHVSEFAQERMRSGNGNRMKDAKLSLFLVNNQKTNITLPPETQLVMELRDVIQLYPQLEGRRPAIEMPRVGL